MSFVFPDLLFAINISDYLTGMKYSAIIGNIKCTLKISSNTIYTKSRNIYQKTMMLKFNIFARYDFKSIKCFFFHFTHKWDGVAKYVLTVNCRKSCQVSSYFNCLLARLPIMQQYLWLEQINFGEMKFSQIISRKESTITLL